MLTFLRKFWQRLNVAQIALLSFATLILVGALLLMLPISSNDGALGFIDAVFTSTSATCVTGLTVVDTGSRFTLFGQIVILAIIQLGGFGIMTFSTFVLFMMGRKATMKLSDGAGESFLMLRHYSLEDMLRTALIFTFVFEAVGAGLLFIRWIPEYPFDQALWLAIFHSVSAFCNAGFSLFPDSLVKYASDPMINFTIMILIISGGIGFFVIFDLWHTIFHDSAPAKRRISFHSKIVLTMSLLLIFGGTILLYTLELNHTFADMSIGQGFMRALFQSVTARTAGFNTVDISHLSNAGLFLLIVLMFIGGAPGSMAGGIKVTTAGVILLVVISRLRGMSTPSLFGRSLTRGDLDRAVSLILLSAGLVTVMTMALLITELGGAAHIDSRGMFMELLFECVSAFGTVGLSTGSTPTLTDAGRVIITFVMFTGRLGPLTLVYAMERRRPRPRLKYPEEKIMIG